MEEHLSLTVAGGDPILAASTTAIQATTGE